MLTTNARPRADRGQRGVTLIEVLVALAIFVVAAVIALTVYDLSRKSFKKGENLTEQQQSVRIAFDRLAADLRMTGFNYNPDGATNRPDEQIEAAFDTAIVIRADFDAEDPTASAAPEDTMIGTDFLSVSIGNDEIAAYVLAKPDGSSPGTLRFRADISNPRDGAVETVAIPNVAMIQNDPPYTLYRITFNNDDSTFPGSGFFVRTPLIENVYSMTFRYFDQVNVQQNSTFDLTTVADDIGGLDTPVALQERDDIRRFGVELVGMTADPDPSYVDPDDPVAATQKFRKFSLTSDIKPRNIGMVGAKDLAGDVIPPNKPATPVLTPGHCGGVLMAWSPNPIDEQVAYYRVNFSTTSGTTGATRSTNTPYYYLAALNDATTYYVTIQAVDSSGNISVKSNEASTTTTNVNTPEAPVNVVASTTLNGVVEVTWDAVTSNTAAVPAADPAKPRVRDLAGYRVYRGSSGSFASATMLADEGVLHPGTSPSFPDVNVVNCRDYHYWVTAVDQCGTESAPSARTDGHGTTDQSPAAPQALQAFYYGSADVKVQWEPVTQDVNGADIFVDTYRVYRTNEWPLDSFLPSEGDFQYVGETVGATSYVDRSPVSDPSLFTAYYRVTTIDDCGNESALSDAVQPACAFSGDVVISNPVNNEAVAGVVPVHVSVVGGSETYAKLVLTFLNRETGTATLVEVATAGPDWAYDWLASPPGPYTIVATVFNDLGCPKSTRVKVAAGYDVGCCRSPPNPSLDPVVLACVGSGSRKCASIQYEVVNNNCLTAVAIEVMEVAWIDRTGNDPKLTGVLFDDTLIWNPTLLASPAATNFSSPKPSIDISRNSVDPVRVTYTFNDNMARRRGQDSYRNPLTTTYRFRLLDSTGTETAITGQCGPSEGMFQNLIVEAP